MPNAKKTPPIPTDPAEVERRLRWVEEARWVLPLVIADLAKTESLEVVPLSILMAMLDPEKDFEEGVKLLSRMKPTKK